MTTLTQHYVDNEWYRSINAQEILLTVLDRSSQKRKQFGLLEAPSLPPQMQIEELTYKLFLCGKSGVGKSCTVAKLAGVEIPKHHHDTPGIEVTEVYWPIRLLREEKTVMFKLQLWDVGDMVLKEYEHILPELQSRADAAIFVFSYVDKQSFDDLAPLMSKMVPPDSNVAKIVIGTKFDQHARSEVTLRDIAQFENIHGLDVLRIKNIPVFHPSGTRTHLTETAPILNSICESLWRRDVEGATSPEPVATYV